MRKAPALLIIAGLIVASLSACSSDPDASCTPPVTSGKASQQIKASGAFGKKPKVTFPTPLKTNTTQATALITGTGAVVHKNQKVLVDASIFDAVTGESIQTTSYDTKSPTPTVLNSSLTPGLAKGMECATVGSRIAIAISPKDGFAALGNPTYKDDTMIAVVDIRRAYLTRANGTPVPHTAGFPSVVLAPDGTPGISITQKQAPKKENVALLKSGHGDTVKKGDSVTVNYTSEYWSQKTVANSTWTSHQPESVLTGADPQKQNQVPAGFVKAIIGKKVGSQVIAIVPPSGKESGVTDTLVFVIDILGID